MFKFGGRWVAKQAAEAAAAETGWRKSERLTVSNMLDVMMVKIIVGSS